MRAPGTRTPRAAVAAALALAVGGCGSATVAELPPAAGPRASPAERVAPEGAVTRATALPPALAPSRGGTETATTRGPARVLGRAREVELLGTGGRAVARADAGVGPAQAISDERWLWVTDTAGDALLVFRLRPELELVRRVHLPGGPYAIALDRAKVRLWVTLTGTNEVAEFAAHGRPHELRRLPTVRQPDAVAVDPVTHEVSVLGDGRLQRFVPPPLA